MANLPTYHLADARAGEVPGADWTGGVNRGGSNASALGVATDVVNPKPQDWPRIQDTVARNSQSIGQTAAPFNVVQGADVNDTAAFVAAAAQIAPGVEIDAVTGAVNRSSTTLESGDWIWGVIPVA